MASVCNHKWEICILPYENINDLNNYPCLVCIKCKDKLTLEEIKKILQTNEWILKRDEI